MHHFKQILVIIYTNKITSFWRCYQKKR